VEIRQSFPNSDYEGIGRRPKEGDDARLISEMKDLQWSRTLVSKAFETQQLVHQQQAKVDYVIASVDADKRRSILYGIKA
jgi:hypothetical protein